MGEMIINRLKGNLPVVIARPTLVSSTYREPFPGWIEGFKTFDPIVISIGRGMLPCFPGNPESFLDIIPGDMVVSAVIMAMMNHLLEYAYDYFSENPWVGKDGNAVKFVMPVFLPTMASFRKHIYHSYVLHKKEQKIIFARRFVEIYEPYTLFKRIFDDSATEKLRISVKANRFEEADMFYFDPKRIDWKDYIINMHIPGLIQLVIHSKN
ncbi:probable fatty acyl-CoA reductase 4 [Papaver somniferum]|uniref:probable fatty acyl-CoA reductase 4 n=1 Tax=Papaver somniferum TaxID=3469 RepID=UPI000E6FF248|nr:probable fatty acyl-CoA reductase 4 [Papaver somniferum]